jgi:hypothetical protein
MDDLLEVVAEELDKIVQTIRAQPEREQSTRR